VVVVKIEDFVGDLIAASRDPCQMYLHCPQSIGLQLSVVENRSEVVATIAGELVWKLCLGSFVVALAFDSGGTRSVCV
jgi:hypothetical protein